MRFSFFTKRTVALDVIQGILIGIGLALVTVIFILPKFYVAKVNGWTTMYGCGEPGAGLLLKGACAVTFAGPINVPQEAMYWETKVDGAGKTLNGVNGYILHFPAGDLPPNSAFWSLTMADPRQQFVANSPDRYNVGSNSGLVQNSDGSTDIYIQATDPAGHESNWLPAPTGDFILWLRVYLPGPTVLNGTYEPPAVTQTQ